jgi:hypothetical protein
LIYTLFRSGYTGAASTIVNFTFSGTAIPGAGKDYNVTGATTFNTTTSSGTVTFTAGATTTSITVTPIATALSKPDETVILTLAPGSGFPSSSGYNLLTPTTATGMILDDNQRVSVAVATTSDPVGNAVFEDGTDNLLYTITRTGSLANSRTVTFSLGGAATWKSDFILPNVPGFTIPTGTVTFAPGASTATVTVDPLADLLVEPDESVVMTLVAGPSYKLGSPSSVTGTIKNDDTTPTPPLVTDDSARGGFVSTSGFVKSTGSGYLNTVLTAAGSASVTNTANWSLGGLASGVYEIAVTWTANSNRATNATYTIKDGAYIVGTVLGTPQVNQKVAPNSFVDGGVTWQTLGTYNVKSGTLSMQLSNKANGYVVADAIRVIWVFAPKVGVAAQTIYGGATSGSTAITNNATSNFGAATIGSTIQQTFTITNRGAGTLALTNLVLPAGFTSTGFSSTTLSGFGSTATITVTMNTSTIGPKSGTLSFNTTDPSNATFNIPLNGTVIKILDDGDAGFTSTGGFTSASGSGYQGDTRTAAGSATATENANWAFSSLPNGTYRISASWVTASNRATNAPFTITVDGVAKPTVLVNQKVAPATFTDQGTAWYDLGTFTVSAGTISVQLTNKANGFVNADAIRIEKL